MSQRDKRPYNDVHFHKDVLPVLLVGLQRAGIAYMNDVKDAKAYVSSLFLVKPMLDPRTGETKEIVFRTNWLSQQEYGDFIRQVKEYGAMELGVFVDEQDEQQGIDLNDDPDLYTTLDFG